MKIKKLINGQIYYMIFSSGYRDYFSIGNDLEVMATNILKRYNKFCCESDKIESLDKMAKISKEQDYNFNTYIINLNDACDLDYVSFDNEIYLGNYLEYINKMREKDNLDKRIAEIKEDITTEKKQTGTIDKIGDQTNSKSKDTIEHGKE